MKYQQPYGITAANPPGAPYVNGNPSTGQRGSIPPAAAFEYPQREIVNLINTAGFTPSDSDLWQVTRAVRQQVNFAQATAPSGANTYYATLDPMLDQYRAGLTLRIVVPVTNTGASTLSIDGLGARSIVRGNGAATAAGDLPAGMVVELIDDGTRFQIANYQGFTSDVTNENTYVVDLPYAADTGTLNAVVGIYTPAITALTEGLAILCKLGHTFTGPATMQVNALPAKPIVHPDGTPLVGGDSVAGAILWLAYDGNKFQLVNFVPPTRPILFAPKDFYVNAGTGSDTNDGLTLSTPFKTIQRALQEILRMDNGGYQVTIHVADGTYTGHIVLPRITGGGSVLILGNHANPQNVNCAEGFYTDTSCGLYILDGLKISNPDFDQTQGHGVNARTTGSVICLVNIEFGLCQGAHMIAFGGAIGLYGSMDGYSSPFIRLTGNAIAHAMTADFGTIDSHNPQLIIANPIQVTYFIQVFMGGINSFYTSIVNPGNVVAGQKYWVHMGGIAHTGLGNSMPGPSAGYLGFGWYD